MHNTGLPAMARSWDWATSVTSACPRSASFGWAASNANAICAQLLLLAAEDPTAIYLYINSPGGSVTAGMAIYDTMQHQAGRRHGHIRAGCVDGSSC